MKHLCIASLASVIAITSPACSKHASKTDAPKTQDAAAHQSAIHTGLMAERVIVRPPLPGRSTAMGMMVLMNHTEANDRLIAVTSPVSDTIEIHTMLNEDGIMKMRRLENGISIPVGRVAELKSGGDHLMMFNTIIPDGAKSVPLTLIFEKGGEVVVNALIDDGTLVQTSDTMDHSGH